MIGLAQNRPLSIWWTLHIQPGCEKRKKSLNYRKSKKTKSDFVEKRFESDQMLDLISNFIHLSLSQNNLSAVRSVLRSLYLNSLNRTKFDALLVDPLRLHFARKTRLSELHNNSCSNSSFANTLTIHQLDFWQIDGSMWQMFSDKNVTTSFHLNHREIPMHPMSSSTDNNEFLSRQIFFIIRFWMHAR